MIFLDNKNDFNDFAESLSFDWPTQYGKERVTVSPWIRAVSGTVNTGVSTINVVYLQWMRPVPVATLDPLTYLFHGDFELCISVNSVTNNCQIQAVAQTLNGQNTLQLISSNNPTIPAVGLQTLNYQTVRPMLFQYIAFRIQTDATGVLNTKIEGYFYGRKISPA